MKVYNRRNADVPPGAIYVGRPSKWGNPYRVGKDGTREEVVERYRAMVTSSLFWRNMIVEELASQDLSCWCAPLPCHADVLMEIANDQG